MTVMMRACRPWSYCTATRFWKDADVAALAQSVPALDLEGLGRHRGRRRAVGLEPQPTQLQFESDMVDALSAVRREHAAPFPLLIEARAPALGTLKLTIGRSVRCEPMAPDRGAPRSVRVRCW